MSVLHYQPVQDEHGDWHAAYVIPGTDVLNSILECPSEAIAEKVCQEENAKQTARMTKLKGRE